MPCVIGRHRPDGKLTCLLLQMSLISCLRLVLTGPATVPAAATATAGKGAAVKPTWKPASGDAAGDAAAVVSRPFPYVYWRLTAGNCRLDNLGWSPEDQQAVMGAAKPTTSLTTAAQPAATPATGVPSPPKAPAAANGPAASQQQPDQVGQLEGAAVAGYDTPCQRAIIRSQKDARQRTEQSLTAAVSGLKLQVYHWVRQEQLWSSAWATMIEELDTV
eukprot:GHUV01055167.1.p2 GENE.GHUV01055167.1~~GHUV01055167.1.p2  ORF type:complete len:218 (+),score=80.96 GHUV01055167.1:2744-3397(+)